jgi:hypothetical protein
MQVDAKHDISRRVSKGLVQGLDNVTKALGKGGK